MEPPGSKCAVSTVRWLPLRSLVPSRTGWVACGLTSSLTKVLSSDDRCWLFTCMLLCMLYVGSGRSSVGVDMAAVRVGKPQFVLVVVLLMSAFATSRVLDDVVGNEIYRCEKKVRATVRGLQKRAKNKSPGLTRRSLLDEGGTSQDTGTTKKWERPACLLSGGVRDTELLYGSPNQQS